MAVVLSFVHRYRARALAASGEVRGGCIYGVRYAIGLIHAITAVRVMTLNPVDTSMAADTRCGATP
jgi:hypothetical protein